MPIYIYLCPEDHETEFFKYRKDEEEPTTCEVLVTREQERTGALETFACGLPLKKKIGGSSWKYARGKNPNWPLTEHNPADDVPRGEDFY